MKLISSVNTRGTLDAKRNRVDEEVRDMTSFGQNIWFLQFFKNSDTCYGPWNLYSLESIWYLGSSLCTVHKMLSQSKESGPRDQHFSLRGVRKELFFHVTCDEFIPGVTHRCF